MEGTILEEFGELKALQQAPFVHASSFGVITDRY